MKEGTNPLVAGGKNILGNSSSAYGDISQTKDEEKGGDEKLNASERIDLQHIMELREAFEQADKDNSYELDPEEVSLSLK